MRSIDPCGNLIVFTFWMKRSSGTRFEKGMETAAGFLVLGARKSCRFEPGVGEQDPVTLLDPDLQLRFQPLFREQPLQNESSLEAADRTDLVTDGDVDQVGHPLERQGPFWRAGARRRRREDPLDAWQGEKAEGEICPQERKPRLRQEAHLPKRELPELVKPGRQGTTSGRQGC